jgi:hypothetical protein
VNAVKPSPTHRDLPALGQIALIAGIGLLIGYVVIGLIYGRSVGPSYFELPRVTLIQLRDLFAQRQTLYVVSLTLLGGCALTAAAGLIAGVWNRRPGPAFVGLALAVAAPFLGLAIFVVTALLTR